MPIDDDLRAALRAGRVVAGRNMIVISPADYARLQASVPPRAGHPSPVTELFEGITIEVVPGHPEGTISIVPLPEPIRFLPSSLDSLRSLPSPLSMAPRWAHGGNGRDGIVIIKEYADPPAPKSLWELLESDED
jgi:hypothetical protein